MDLTSIKTIKELLIKYKARPSKRMGQHFLINRSILNKIISTADIKSFDTVIEIGPGIGTLTRELSKKAKTVIAIEKDRTMVEILKETVSNLSNVTIIQGDILALNHNSPLLLKIIKKRYALVANLPYYITSPVIRMFLESSNQPLEMVIMVQKEVAQRICANPPNMSLLAVSVQYYAKPSMVSYVKKGSFWPKPDVDSAILRISNIHNDKKNDTGAFFHIVKAGFSQPRKQLLNNLYKTLGIKREETSRWLLKNGVRPEQRAQTLSVADWKRLAENLSQ